MKLKFLLGIFWRYLAWSAGASLGVGLLLPSLLIGAFWLISGFLSSDQSHAGANAGADFGGLLLIMLVSGLVGAYFGVRIGVPVGIVSGIVVGLLSIIWFDPPLSERRYRLATAVTVLVISIGVVIIGFPIDVVDRYSGFDLIYPTLVVVGIVEILICDHVAHWYLSRSSAGSTTIIPVD